MSDTIEANILIIGKSGVGKSSLLNYILGEEKAKTGSGEPVTEKGFHKEKLKIKEDFIVNITDTWGLEANKAEEWESFIKNDIKERDKKGITQWYHTILFCISAKGARIEEFEKNIIKNLLESKNKVIIVLTHSDLNNVEKAIRAIEGELIGLGIEKNNIIQVSSVEKKLLTGKRVKPFGRDKIIEKIKINIWDLIIEKLPFRLEEIATEELDKWCEKTIEYSNIQLKWHNKSSSKLINRVGRYAKLGLEITIEEIDILSKREISEVEWMYKKFIKNCSEKLSFKKKEDRELREELEAIPKEVLKAIIKFSSLKDTLKTLNMKKSDINKTIVQKRQKTLDIYLKRIYEKNSLIY